MEVHWPGDSGSLKGRFPSLVPLSLSVPSISLPIVGLNPGPVPVHYALYPGAIPQKEFLAKPQQQNMRDSSKDT